MGTGQRDSGWPGLALMHGVTVQRSGGTGSLTIAKDVWQGPISWGEDICKERGLNTTQAQKHIR